MTDIVSPVLSEDFLSLQFTARHVHDLRFVPVWGKWLRWDGMRWKEDTTLAAFDLARKVVRDHAVDLAEITTGNGAIALASAKTIAAVERLARSDQMLARSPDVWDTDAWLINTRNGVVDLRHAALLPHDPNFYMTKLTAAGATGDCPLWLAFLDRVAAGDKELIAYLQRVAGYCLTGSTRDHALFFLYGTGGNGKGVFLNTLRGIWADYAVVAAMETFVETTTDRHPTDLAMLRGARLVIAQETEKGRHWAEAKISALTGGDPIRARFMRQDFFEYVPQFKLVIAGNHKPALKSVNEAIRRRIHMIPFLVTIPDSEKDFELPEKLKAEWPGIMQWAIDGCLEWQQIGLAPPTVVADATAEYLANEDTFTNWTAECCVTGETHWGIGARLWASWKAWAEASNEKPGTRKAFAPTMVDHGFRRAKSQEVRGYDGIALKPEYSGSRYAAD
jgi:P4 family phage/plasmid primase-like protien